LGGCAAGVLGAGENSDPLKRVRPPTLGEMTVPESDAALLQQFLTGRDSACPQCDYNLRDLRGDRCPECGEMLVLRVSVAAPKQMLLIAGLVALSAGAGLNGLLLIYMGIQLMLGRWYAANPTQDEFFVINAVGFAVEALAIGAWLWRWRAIRQRPRIVQTTLVLCCCAMTLADIVIFSIRVR